MGDMAEYSLQQGLDNWAYGDEDWGYSGEGGYGPLPKICRRCHASNLWWALSGGKWKLIDSAGNKHVCAASVLNAAAKKVFK